MMFSVINDIFDRSLQEPTYMSSPTEYIFSVPLSQLVLQSPSYALLNDPATSFSKLTFAKLSFSTFGTRYYGFNKLDFHVSYMTSSPSAESFWYSFTDLNLVPLFDPQSGSFSERFSLTNASQRTILLKELFFSPQCPFRLDRPYKSQGDDCSVFHFGHHEMGGSQDCIFDMVNLSLHVTFDKQVFSRLFDLFFHCCLLCSTLFPNKDILVTLLPLFRRVFFRPLDVILSLDFKLE